MDSSAWYCVDAERTRVMLLLSDAYEYISISSSSSVQATRLLARGDDDQVDTWESFGQVIAVGYEATRQLPDLRGQTAASVGPLGPVCLMGKSGGIGRKNSKDSIASAG